jgi:hypothetical protein
MSGLVLCPRCGTVSQGGVVLPPGAEPVVLESSGSSSESYICPVCKATIPPDAQEESKDLVGPLLEIAKSNRALVEEVKDMAQSLIKAGATHQQADEVVSSRMPEAIRRVWRHIPSERTSSFLALLVAATALVLQLTDRRKDPQTKSESHWPLSESYPQGELFDDFSRGLDLAKKWTLKREKGFDFGQPRQIYVEQGKLHFCARAPQISAFLAPKLPDLGSKTIQKVSMKMALLSSKADQLSVGFVGIDVSTKTGRLQKLSMGRWYRRPMFEYEINFIQDDEPLHREWPSSIGYALEVGREYFIEVTVYAMAVEFNIVGHSYARAPADSGSIAGFGLNFSCYVESHQPPPRRDYLHVTVDDVRIAYLE